MEAGTEERERTIPRALQEASTLCEAFQITVAEHGDKPAIRTKDDEVSLTWSEYGERVRRVTAGLASLGLGKGDTVGLMLTNRPEFYWCDAGAQHLGALPYSIYNTYTPDQIAYLLGDAASRVLITEQAFVEQVLAAQRENPTLEHVVVVDGDAPEGGMTLDDLMSRGEEGFDFEAAWRAVEEGDLLTIIYTSGTTGPPKGVQLEHRNVRSGIRAFDATIGFPVNGRVISWLPLAHIAERACSLYLPMFFGMSVTCCPDPRQIAAYLPAVRPSWFFAVPRIWEKLKAALEAGFAAEQDENRKAAIDWAIQTGLKRVRAEQAGEQLDEETAKQAEQADQLVLSKIREKLGLDQLVAVNVGAAPSAPEVLEFFHAIGVPVAELWGMSETDGAGACNPKEKVKIGTVGVAPPGIELKIAEDGELLVRGGVVMRDYRNQPDKTRETIDEEGFLHTGDIAQIDDEGYVKIVDRKKELIINAAGKNMSPANIEAAVKTSSPLIGQAIAIGDRRPYNVALITLDPDVAPGFAQQNGIEDASFEAMCDHPKVVEEVQRGIDRANEQLARVEQIKKFKVLPTDWQPGGDELTPTMKLKRKPIGEKYADEIEALYAE
jgi:long-chain acyl-CoA synthetase